MGSTEGIGVPRHLILSWSVGKIGRWASILVRDVRC
ncbi:hypothetical protein LINPERPRIM_LOCUS17374 [Linum perenne]